MAPKCGVCVETESKYKCPTCRIPYCSLPCYKVHKETPCRKEEAIPAQNGEGEAFGQPPRSFEDNQDDTGWRLKRTQLESLAAFDDIRRMLRDDDLQKLIRRVDSSVNPEKDLDKALEGPAFKEFTDKILAMVNADKSSLSTLGMQS